MSTDSARLGALADSLIQDAANRAWLGEGPSRVLHRLVQANAGPDWEPLVQRRLSELTTQAAALALERGWEPRDLCSFVRRKAGAAAAAAAQGVLAEAVHRCKPAPWKVQRWEEQLAGMAGAASMAGAAGAAWPHDGVAVAIAALGVLLNLAALSEIGPPAQPGSPLAGMDPAVLDKVRALLAKAEATEFEEEADAFLSKAQELMSRYNLDRACLDEARDGSGSGVEALRCWLDDPYWRQKAYLLGVVARANRCRSVVSFDLGMETVIGHRDDLAATELLFTALLLHATKHMAQARTRRSSYRRSFLVAYATRIGDRLSEAAAAATLAAVRDSGVGLLPVLASREASVEETVERMFPATRPTRFQVTDRDGYVAGLAAADLADLAVQPILTTTEH